MSKDGCPVSKAAIVRFYPVLLFDKMRSCGDPVFSWLGNMDA
jgi:hypothetical protein